MAQPTILSAYDAVFMKIAVLKALANIYMEQKKKSVRHICVDVYIALVVFSPYFFWHATNTLKKNVYLRERYIT